MVLGGHNRGGGGDGLCYVMLLHSARGITIHVSFMILCHVGFSILQAV